MLMLFTAHHEPECCSFLIFWHRFLDIWRRSGKNCSLLSQKLIRSCEKSPLPSRMEIQQSLVSFGFYPCIGTRLTDLSLLLLDWAPAHSGSLADLLAKKDLADFCLKLLQDFLAVGFAYSVNDILSYLNITNLPINVIDYCHKPSISFCRRFPCCFYIRGDVCIIRKVQPTWNL
jgi:hypothetical protein